MRVPVLWLVTISDGGCGRAEGLEGCQAHCAVEQEAKLRGP